MRMIGIAAFMALACSGAPPVAIQAKPERPVSDPAPSVEPSQPSSAAAEAQLVSPKPPEDPFRCPDEPPEPSDGSPSFVVDQVGELYEMMVNDYLDIYGELGKPVRSLPPAQAERAVCAALKGSYIVLGRIQEGRAVPRVKTPCVDKEKQSLSMRRFNWELSRLPSGKYLATRTAGPVWPEESAMHRIETEVRDGLVLTTVSDRAWRCPLDPEDPCGAFEIDGGKFDVRCRTDERTTCTDAGFSSELFVLDLANGQTVRFGDFWRRPAPYVTVTLQEVTVTAGDCTQSARRPWSGAP